MWLRFLTLFNVTIFSFSVDIIYAQDSIQFTDEEKSIIASFGPWPPLSKPDPSNNASGNLDAITLGEQLFFDTRLSENNQISCASCHLPGYVFAEPKPRSHTIERVDRNAPALVNLRLNRWYGWGGKSDNLWAQSFSPILDPKEMGSDGELIVDRLLSDNETAAKYQTVFNDDNSDHSVDQALVNFGKALAAFQETIVSSRTPFDEFRDALVNGGKTISSSDYPLAAQRGLRIFIGKGECHVCHAGPNFTNNEFHDIGLPFFPETDRVDSGRYGGIEKLKSSPFTLLSKYNDNPQDAKGMATRLVRIQPSNWGQFRVPSLRMVAQTAPYMHDGSLATLEEVVSHYSDLDVERLHAQGEGLLRPLHLSEQEHHDLVSFLETLSE